MGPNLKSIIKASQTIAASLSITGSATPALAEDYLRIQNNDGVQELKIPSAPHSEVVKLFRPYQNSSVPFLVLCALPAVVGAGIGFTLFKRAELKGLGFGVGLFGGLLGGSAVGGIEGVSDWWEKVDRVSISTEVIQVNSENSVKLRPAASRKPDIIINQQTITVKDIPVPLELESVKKPLVVGDRLTAILIVDRTSKEVVGWTTEDALRNPYWGGEDGSYRVVDPIVEK